MLAVALLTNQEIFNAYLVWGDQQFDLDFFGTTMPTTWLITLDAIAQLLDAGRRRRLLAMVGHASGSEPDEITKIIIGSLFTIAGGALPVHGRADAAAPARKIGLFWPVMFHLFNSIGFAHVLPISLALFAKIAPQGDQRDRDRPLLSGFLHRQHDGRLGRRLLFERCRPPPSG